MKISRTSEDHKIPEWALENKETKDFADKDAVSLESIERVAKMKDEITSDELVVEKEIVEKCASSKSHYFYNDCWSKEAKQELKEYAIACNMDMSKFKSVDTIGFNNKYAGTKQMIKTASTTIQLGDPFKIDEKLASSRDRVSSRDKSGEWKANVSKELKLSEKPSMSGIVPVRGGEDYNANSEPKVARGQNSIMNPSAIETLAESSEEDTGKRLRRENEERSNSRKEKLAAWEQEKIDEMVAKNILPSRHVFPTEVMNAQPGIRGKVLDLDSIPEKTEGEKIKEANIERKESIRGKEKEKHEFVTSRSPTREISDVFSQELKKALGK